MLKQQQILKQIQGLKLTPQQLLTMNLLELPMLDLETRIHEEIIDNPVLEEINPDNTVDKDEHFEDIKEHHDDEFNTLEDEETYDYDNDIPNYKLTTPASPEANKYEKTIVSGESFQDTLLHQVNFLMMSELDRKIADFLIGNIDESGYLSRSLDDLADDLALSYNLQISVNEIEDVRKKILLYLDPPGVGARDLQECLQIQLNRLEKNKAVELALRIVENYFKEFTTKQYHKIITKLEIDESSLKEAIDEILKCNPKPGDNQNTTENIIPDFIMTQTDNKLEIALSQKYHSELKISDDYQNMFNKLHSIKHKDKETWTFIKDKMDKGLMFINALQQREQTLLKVMPVIANLQKEFFLTGDEAKLKPMILKDIASKVNMDISTISRVVNKKYVQTDFGTYLLKSLFSESLQNEFGEEVSSKEIKQMIQNIIEGEDKTKPLTDDQIRAILKERKYMIARRTVAKYRESLGFQKSNLRKELI